MARRANPALIGAFVLGAVVLAVAGLVVIGGGKFFRHTLTWVAYFDESIKGLGIGAPVMFRGVKVGAVTDIKVVVDRKDVAITTPVFFELEANRLTDASGGTIRFDTASRPAQLLIDRGLRAQLEMQSLVTGQLAIQLEFHPGTPIRLVATDRRFPEMPTIASSTERISRTLENLPLDQIAASALKAIEGISQLVNGPEIKETLASVRTAFASAQQLLGDVQKLARTVDGRIGPLASGIDQTLESGRETLKEVQALVRHVDGDVVPAAKDALQDARTLVHDVDGHVAPLMATIDKTLVAAATTLEEAQRVLGAVDYTISEGSPLQYELMLTLRDVAAAARSLRTLGDYIDRHPEALVFGKSPAKGR